MFLSCFPPMCLPTTSVSYERTFASLNLTYKATVIWH